MNEVINITPTEPKLSTSNVGDVGTIKLNNLPPLDTTFVWGSLRSQDTDLFIIQHNHGADLETFMHYSSFFGEIDPKSLNSSKRFVLVTDDALEMVEASQVKEEAPKPKVDEPLHPSDEILKEIERLNK